MGMAVRQMALLRVVGVLHKPAHWCGSFGVSAACLDVCL